MIVVPITEAGVSLPFPLKVLISVVLISPAGLAMGMPFPTGLALLNKNMPAAIRWAWAVNAASSVMGSAAAMFLAIYLGLEITLGDRWAFVPTCVRQHCAIALESQDSRFRWP